MQRSCERGVEKLLPKKSKVLQLFWNLERHAGLLWTYATCLFMVRAHQIQQKSQLAILLHYIAFSVALVYGIEI
jgi:hypothetical protein